MEIQNKDRSCKSERINELQFNRDLGHYIIIAYMIGLFRINDNCHKFQNYRKYLHCSIYTVVYAKNSSKCFVSVVDSSEIMWILDSLASTTLDPFCVITLQLQIRYRISLIGISSVNMPKIWQHSETQSIFNLEML